MLNRSSRHFPTLCPILITYKYRRSPQHINRSIFRKHDLSSHIDKLIKIAPLRRIKNSVRGMRNLTYITVAIINYRIPIHTIIYIINSSLPYSTRAEQASILTINPFPYKQFPISSIFRRFLFRRILGNTKPCTSIIHHLIIIIVRIS